MKKAKGLISTNELVQNGHGERVQHRGHSRWHPGKLCVVPDGGVIYQDDRSVGYMGSGHWAVCMYTSMYTY